MTTNQIAVKMLMDRWNGAMKNCDDLLNSISDDQLQKEASPCKNRGIYILGHLIAVHDDMLRLLDMGTIKYPELTKIFKMHPRKQFQKFRHQKNCEQFGMTRRQI